MSNKKEMSIQGKALFPGVIVYHYIYGEMMINKVDRVKTKFEQFVYIEASVLDITSISKAYVEKAKLNLKSDKLRVCFNQDTAKEWLSIDPDNIKIVEPLYANKIFDNKIRSM